MAKSETVGIAFPRTLAQAGEAVLQIIVVGLGTVGVMAGATAVFLPLILIRSWALMKVWNWYATPFFHTPHMTMLTAFGILEGISLLTPVKDSGHDDGAKKAGFWQRYLTIVAVALATVLFAWIGITFF